MLLLEFCASQLLKRGAGASAEILFSILVKAIVSSLEDLSSWKKHAFKRMKPLLYSLLRVYKVLDTKGNPEIVRRNKIGGERSEAGAEGGEGGGGGGAAGAVLKIH